MQINPKDFEEVGQLPANIDPVWEATMISLLRDGSIALITLFLTYLVSRWVIGLLKSYHFEEFFDLPWKPLKESDPQDLHLGPNHVIGIMVGATLVLAGLSFISSFGDININLSSFWQLLGHTWLFATTTLIAFACARIVAGAVIRVFENPTIRKQLEAIFPAEPATNSENGFQTPQQVLKLQPASESFADTLARFVGLLIYVGVFLPVFMIAAEIWQWTATGNAIAEVWSWLLPFAGMTALVLIGWFAITTAALTLFPETHKRSVVIATSGIALMMIIAIYSSIFALGLLVLFLVALWFLRDYIPDATAGMYLRFQKNSKISSELGQAQVWEMSLLISQCKTETHTFQTRNRYVFKSVIDGTPIPETRMVNLKAKSQAITPEMSDEDIASII